MEHFFKYLDSRPTVHKETKYINRYKTENKHKSTLQNTKPRKIQNIKHGK